jgi:hypothetical protein
MITRTAFALGMVWLFMPHHPDLGLPATPNSSCTAPDCEAAQQERDAIFQRLRAVRSEIQADGRAQYGMLSGVVYGQGEGLQKAGPPQLRHRRLRRMASNAQGERP